MRKSDYEEIDLSLELISLVSIPYHLPPVIKRYLWGDMCRYSATSGTYLGIYNVLTGAIVLREICNEHPTRGSRASHGCLKLHKRAEHMGFGIAANMSWLHGGQSCGKPMCYILCLEKSGQGHFVLREIWTGPFVLREIHTK